MKQDPADPPRLDEMFDKQDLDELIVVRDSMGWNPGTWEKLPIRLMCVISELEELEEAMGVARAAQEHTVEELADVAMYLMCTLHDVFPLWTIESRSQTSGGRTAHERPETLCKPVRSACVAAMQSWRRPNNFGFEYHQAGVQEDLEHALYNTFYLANTLGIHLPTAIRAKMTVLRGRELRNGGKHPDT